MPLEAPLAPVQDRVDDLNFRFRGHGAVSVLSHALSDGMIGQSALVSSFGTESVVLLHLISIMDRSLPVIFVDTELLFPETLEYQTTLASKFGLTNVNIVKPRRSALFDKDPDGILHHFEPNACCNLRKVEPLQNALSGFDAWITGRKRYQGGTRQDVSFFENENDQRIKINPLAYWSRDDLLDYITNNKLPRHPLVNKGFPSVGCHPCTGPAGQDEDSRAGRWRGMTKSECGIHFSPEGVERKALS